ncbi:hypothetical protein F4778DRAFT_213609 [Xylariomycetidae sp. FL2044]|nr:hypothetical protein F4778DRAFT_213609 [Xylariomycetidae sp. FL2044]
MDRPTRIGSAGGRPTPNFPGRHRGLVLAAIAVTGVAAGIQYKRSSMTRNERAQSGDAGSPNLYVSVDRSGGGI